MLFIDTPGHEAFNNLRKIGSSACDIGILVIDIVHGLENQTKESIQLLKETNTPFIIALNKIDRLYGWVSHLDWNFESSLKSQTSSTQDEFYTRVKKISIQLMELGLNVKLFYEPDNFTLDDTTDDFINRHIISMCPISAITTEGIPELLLTGITWTQKNFSDKITYLDETKCILMGTTKVEGFGTTLDIILINGKLSVGDCVNLCTESGIVQSQIKSILTIEPNKELRIKTDYFNCSTVKASTGVKLVLSNCEENCIEGSYITLANQKLTLLPTINKNNFQESGVLVFSSSSGSLSALIKFLQAECEPPVPIFGAKIGNILAKHIKKFSIANEKSLPEHKVILAFNLKIDEQVEALAKGLNIKIFSAEIIYNLFDMYKKYLETLHNERKSQSKDKVIFPCELKILPKCIFNKKNPLIFGVDVLEGNLHIGTELSDESGQYIGKVIGIQNNKVDVNIGKKSSQVCIRVENSVNESITYGRHFSDDKLLYSRITRESIDLLKQYYRKECTKEDLLLLVKIKKIFNIE
jgi:translation initiation factor 5B